MQNNQEKLDEMYEMMQENNEILRSLLRRERFANFLRIMYWIFIIGTLLGAYYYVQPVLTKMTANFDGLQSTVTHINENISSVGNSLPETKTIKSFFETIKNMAGKSAN